MTGPLRVGVIGANPNRSWAKDSHIPALRSLENVQLAAVATTSRASADAAAAAFGVRAAYDDPLALITASDIDIVSVCVRVPYHRDLVLAALAADKHVYCEWPLGRDRGEAAEMAAAARVRLIRRRPSWPANSPSTVIDRRTSPFASTSRSYPPKAAAATCWSTARLPIRC